MRKSRHEQRRVGGKKRRKEVKSVPRTLQSRSVSGRESDLYVKTDLHMKTANSERFCCVFKHTHRHTHARFPEGRFAGRGCKIIIPQLRVPVASRVPSEDSGVPAACQPAGSTHGSPPVPGGVSSRVPLPIVECQYRKLFRLSHAVEAHTGHPLSCHCRETTQHKGFGL